MNDPFDFTPYEFALTDPVMSLDRVHIQMLYLCAVLAPGVCAVEVGSGHGASTAALVQAANDGYLEVVHSIEPNSNESLGRVLSLASCDGRTTWSVGPYHSAPRYGESLVFIDGDHGWHALADVLTALARDVPVIAMHDTATSDTWGSHLAAGILSKCRDRQVFYDKATREGMLTHRGFMVSAKKGIDLSLLEEYVKSL